MTSRSTDERPRGPRLDDFAGVFLAPRHEKTDIKGRYAHDYIVNRDGSHGENVIIFGIRVWRGKLACLEFAPLDHPETPGRLLSDPDRLDLWSMDKLERWADRLLSDIEIAAIKAAHPERSFEYDVAETPTDERAAARMLEYLQTQDRDRVKRERWNEEEDDRERRILARIEDWQGRRSTKAADAALLAFLRAPVNQRKPADGAGSVTAIEKYFQKSRK